MFESAIVDSGVLDPTYRQGPPRSFPGVDMDRLRCQGGPASRRAYGVVCGPTSDAPWSILSPLEQSVLDKMIDCRDATQVDWDVRINRGITDGVQQGLHHRPAKTRDALIADEDPRVDGDYHCASSAGPGHPAAIEYRVGRTGG